MRPRLFCLPWIRLWPFWRLLSALQASKTVCFWIWVHRSHRQRKTPCRRSALRSWCPSLRIHQWALRLCLGDHPLFWPVRPPQQCPRAFHGAVDGGKTVKVVCSVLELWGDNVEHVVRLVVYWNGVLVDCHIQAPWACRAFSSSLPYGQPSWGSESAYSRTGLALSHRASTCRTECACAGSLHSLWTWSCTQSVHTGSTCTCKSLAKKSPYPYRVVPVRELNL